MSRFYKLPAHLLVAGVSTDDGQDVLEVQAADGIVNVTDEERAKIMSLNAAKLYNIPLD